MQVNHVSTLKLNIQTGKYEGYLVEIRKVEVEQDIFRNVLIQAIKDDTRADLTDLTEISERVAKVASWIHKPNTKVTPISLDDLPPELKPVSTHRTTVPVSSLKEDATDQSLIQVSIPHQSEKQTRKTQMQILEERIREKAKHIPPHLWEEKVLTPSYDMHDKDVTERHRADRGRLRYGERKVLRLLRQEREEGTFTLDEDAELEEEIFWEDDANKLTEKIVAVAEVVNANGYH